MEALREDLGGPGGQEAPRHHIGVRRGTEFALSLAEFASQVEAQNRSKSLSRAIKNNIIFMIDLKIDLGSDLVPIWFRFGSQSRSKMEPNFDQNQCEVGQ